MKAEPHRKFVGLDRANTMRAQAVNPFASNAEFSRENRRRVLTYKSLNRTERQPAHGVFVHVFPSHPPRRGIRNVSYVNNVCIAITSRIGGPLTVPNMAVIHYDIPDDTHRRAKSAAALQGVTLKDFLVAALEDAIKRSAKGQR